MLRLFYLLIIGTFLVLSSCKDEKSDPDYCSTAWSTQVQDELNAVISAATTYASDQTTQNCNAYKAAYQNYIDAMEPFGNCTIWSAQDKTAWENAIDEARAEISTLCN
jgi:hypothetical protein